VSAAILLFSRLFSSSLRPITLAIRRSSSCTPASHTTSQPHYVTATLRHQSHYVIVNHIHRHGSHTTSPSVTSTAADHLTQRNKHSNVNAHTHNGSAHDALGLHRKGNVLSTMLGCTLTLETYKWKTKTGAAAVLRLLRSKHRNIFNHLQKGRALSVKIR